MDNTLQNIGSAQKMSNVYKYKYTHIKNYFILLESLHLNKKLTQNPKKISIVIKMENKFSEEEVENFVNSTQAKKIKALRNVMLDLVQAAKKEEITFPEIMTALNGVYITVCVNRGVPPEDFKKGVELMISYYKDVYEEIK
jgi:hypothetical protein